MKSGIWWNRCSRTIITGVGILLMPVILSGESMPEQTSHHAIVGTWEKITRSVCSASYPDHLQFQPGNLFFGKPNTPGMFMQWDVGTYAITGPDQIKISTANDAIITYRFSITGKVLSFSDPEGCEYSYQRSEN